MPYPFIEASLLAADFSRLREEVSSVEEAGADGLHLDIMDGHFVPNLTFGPCVIAALRPHTSLSFNAHLMVERPEDLLQSLKQAGVERVTVHPEGAQHLHRTLMEIRSLGMKGGVALNPATSPDFIPYILPLIDHILVMTVNPGFGGQSFLFEMLDKISHIQRLTEGLPLTIQVDGGITPQTAPHVIARGAHSLVVGTSLFKSSSYAETISLLRGQ